MLRQRCCQWAAAAGHLAACHLAACHKTISKPFKLEPQVRCQAGKVSKAYAPGSAQRMAAQSYPAWVAQRLGVTQEQLNFSRSNCDVYCDELFGCGSITTVTSHCKVCKVSRVVTLYFSP